MTHQKLWQRYLCKEIAKTFFLVLCSIYFLYLLIDYSIQFKAGTKGAAAPAADIAFYYVALFSKRANFLLSLALTIATVKVLCTLNRANELLAFQTAGLSLFSLFRPFLFAAFCCSLANLYNFEYLLPSCHAAIDRFEHSHLKRSLSTHSSVHAASLDQNATLIYQSHDPHTATLNDVFLVYSVNDIWHAKKLVLTPPHPTGFCVDHMVRCQDGRLEKSASFSTYTFTQFCSSLNLYQTSADLLRQLPLTALAARASDTDSPSIETLWTAQTHLYFNLATSFLPFLLVIGVAPFCISSKRNFSPFFIFALAIFCQIFLFALLDACSILGESQVIAPGWAIFGVPLTLFFGFGFIFLKTCFHKRT